MTLYSFTKWKCREIYCVVINSIEECCCFFTVQWQLQKYTVRKEFSIAANCKWQQQLFLISGMPATLYPPLIQVQHVKNVQNQTVFFSSTIHQDIKTKHLMYSIFLQVKVPAHFYKLIHIFIYLINNPIIDSLYLY